jgi:non-ribosomal peptide synthetase component F
MCGRQEFSGPPAAEHALPARRTGDRPGNWDSTPTSAEDCCFDCDTKLCPLAPGGHRRHVRRVRGKATRLAHRFRRAGLRKGDVVAILMQNNEHIHAIMWVAQRSGGRPRDLKEEENNNPRAFHQPC